MTQKIVQGFVRQLFDDDGKLISQEFEFDGEIQYLDDDGDEIIIPKPMHLYHPYDMVNPDPQDS
jgi:hypothetical protein